MIILISGVVVLAVALILYACLVVARWADDSDEATSE